MIKKSLIKIILIILIGITIFVLINLNIKFSRILLIILIAMSIYLGMSIQKLKHSGKQEEEVQTSSPKNQEFSEEFFTKGMS